MCFIKRKSYFIFGVLFFLVGELNGLNAMEDNKSGITEIGCHDYTCKQEVWEDKKKIPEGSYMVVSNENLFDKDPMTVYLPFCSSYEDQSSTLREINDEIGIASSILTIEDTLNTYNTFLTENEKIKKKLRQKLQFYTTVNVDDNKKIEGMIEKCTCCNAKLYEGNLNSKSKFICFVPYEEHCVKQSILHFFKGSTERLCRKCMIERLKTYLLTIMNEKEITSYGSILEYVYENRLDLPREHWSPNEFVDARTRQSVYGGYTYPTFDLLNYCAPKSDIFSVLLSDNYKSSEVIPFINMIEVMNDLLKEVKVPKKEEKKEDKKKNKCVIF